MTLVSGLAIGLSIVFGCLLLALIVEIYYLLWWKKQVITNNNNNNNNNTKEIFSLFCWEKPPTISNSTNTTTNHVISNTNHDLEMGLKGLGGGGEEGSIESELMRIHNLSGLPRFLFTIKEETKEDLESINDNNNKKKNYCYNNNPLFEESSSCIEDEVFRLRSSPPPKFKFLRDAEEKLYRKLVEEAHKCRL